MKILFLARRFYPDIGGVEKHVYKISKILVKKGHEVVVITESQGKENIIDGIKIVRIRSEKENKLKKFKIWLSLFKYLPLIKSSDVVHCHDVFYWYLPFRFIFLFKKVYTTFHGYEGNNLPTKKSIFMHKIAEKLSDGNICVGDYLKKWYGTVPNQVTCGAADIKKPKDLAKISKQKKRVIFIGRLEEETGIMEYLEVVAILKKKNINIILDIYGDGKLRNESMKYSKNHKLAVNLRGFVANVSDLIDKYEYVFTSRYLSTLESFTFKKLVFCLYNNEIKRDVFKLSPFKDFIIMENNADNLALRVIEYNKNPKLFSDKIDSAYAWVKNQTWDKLTNQYLELWRN